MEDLKMDFLGEDAPQWCYENCENKDCDDATPCRCENSCNCECNDYKPCEECEPQTDLTKTLANSISESIKYIMFKDILVKPLPDIMITKTIEEPVVDDTIEEDGEKINNYKEVKTREITVTSALATGIVIALPKTQVEGINVGDTISYNRRFSSPFDLLKDSVLVKPYDVISINK